MVGAALGPLLLLVVGPVLRSLAKSRAAALGLELDAKDASLGLGVVHLRNVSIASRFVPGVSVTLTRVDVYPSLSLSIRRLAVHGGSVRVTGPASELERQIDAFRGSSRTHAGGEPRSIPLAIDGIDVVWSDAFGGHESEYAWGLRLTRAEDGSEVVGADLVRASHGRSELEVGGGYVELGRRGDHRVVSRLGATRLLARLDLDAERSSSEPNDDAAPSPGVRAIPVSVRTTPPAADDAEDESGLGAFAAAGPELRARLARAARALAPSLPPSAEVALTGARFEIRHAGQTLNVGPADVTLRNDSDRLRLAVKPGAENAAAPLELELTVPTGDGPVDVRLEGGPVDLAALGVREGDMGLLDVAHAEVEVNGKARLSADGKAVSLSGRSRLSDLSIYQPKLAADPVRGLSVSLGGDASFELDGSRVDLRDVQIGIGKVRLEASGGLLRAEGHANGKLHLDVPLAACSDMLGSVPPGLVPMLRGLELTGTFALSGEVAFDTRRPGDTGIAWDMANECKVTRVPEALSPDRFSKPWVRTVQGADGRPVTIESGPGTPDWVPLEDISPYVQTGIVVCEDSRFWSHDGFDQKAMQDAIRDNLRAGRFVRGASTVSMQLAKNLYLGREKTLARKLQEAFLTLLLEQVLTKEQILELYLNVIEFAPGVYGIGPAAAHYFRSLPKDLSLAQSLYLTSILPNPKNTHFGRDGLLHETWAAYLRHLMDIAYKIHRIDDRDLAEGRAEIVRFGEPSTIEGLPATDAEFTHPNGYDHGEVGLPPEDGP
jgi:hypothetical protein